MSAESAITDILTRTVPGFGSYLSQQRRRDEDASVRKYLIGRLQECKRDLQPVLTTLVDAGKFDVVVQGEKLRSAIELAQSKMRAAFEGYSSWFDKVQIDSDKLKQVVDLDNELVGTIDRLQSAIGKLDKIAPSFTEAASFVSDLQQRFLRRNEILSRG